jgi:hypothetical protein
MYVVKTDYKTIISTALLDTIIKEAEADTGEDILQTVNRIAEDTIAIKAGVLYNIVSELSKTGMDRNFMILSLAISIAGYWLYQRIDDEEVPAKVVKNYNDAINTLDQISRGKEPLNLAPKPAQGNTDNGSGAGEEVITDGSGLWRIGSQPRRSHQV